MTMPISDPGQIKSILNCCHKEKTKEVIKKDDPDLWPQEE